MYNTLILNELVINLHIIKTLVLLLLLQWGLPVEQIIVLTTRVLTTKIMNNSATYYISKVDR